MRNSPFIRTFDTIERARLTLKQLESSSQPEDFRNNFRSLISIIREVTFVMQKEGANISRFNLWYKKKQIEMKNDALLSYVRDLRNKIVKEGEDDLVVSAEYHDVEIKVHPGEKVVFRDAVPRKVVNKNTPKETFEQADMKGSWTTFYALKNPPEVHQGEKILDNTPVGIGRLAVFYFENLLFELNKVIKN